jgi:tetratricopeptide (TPR) repeat protein
MRFDREVGDLLDVQDEVRQQIFKTLSVRLTNEERARERKRYTDSFEAYDYFLRGQASLVKRSGVADYLNARDNFEKAIELDPGFARAWSGVALAHADAYRFGWRNESTETGRLAVEAGQRAIALDNNLPQAYWVMGYIELYVNHNYEKAVELGRRCIELAPSNADGYALLAIINVYLEKADKAIRFINEAMRLNPHYPSMYPSVLGQAHLVNNNAPLAREAFEESLAINPTRQQGNVHMIVALVRLGEIEEARWQAEQFKMNYPGFSAQEWVKHHRFSDQASTQRMLEDLQKAGF